MAPAFYIALVVFIAVGVLVLSRRMQRRRVPVAPSVVEIESTVVEPVVVELEPEPEHAPQPVEAKPRSAEDLQVLVSMLHQRELAAEHRAFGGKHGDVVDLPAVEAGEREWQNRQAHVAELHERELAAEHRAFAQGREH